MWTLIGYLGAGLVGLVAFSFFAKWAGVYDLVLTISSVFQTMWHVIRIPLEFVINHLPKPFKVFLVLVLFSVVGGLIYTLTLGMTYVCDPNSAMSDGGVVYKTGMFEGFAYIYAPDDVGVEPVKVNNVTIGGVELSGATVNGNLVEKEIISYNGLNVEVTNTFGVINDISSKTTDLGSILLLPTNKRWEAMVPYFVDKGGKKYYSVSICMETYSDGTTNKNGGKNPFRNNICVLKREKDPVLPIDMDAIGKDACDEWTDSNAVFDTNVGRIRYEWVPDTGSSNSGGNVKATFQPSESSFNNWGMWGVMTGILNGPTLKDCVSAETANREIDKITDKSYRLMDVDYASWSGDLHAVGAVIYNTGNLPMMYTAPDYDGSRNLVSEDYGEGRRRMIEGFSSPVVSKSSDLIKYSCDAAAENKYKTNVTIGGVNPFDVTVLTFIFLIGMILSVYGWFRRW